MLVFAHLGFALAAAEVVALACRRHHRNSENREDPGVSLPGKVVGGVEDDGRRLRLPALLEVETTALALAKSIDCRLLLLGAVLPDLIDKPLGVVILGSVFSYGRIYCHTLVFAVVLSALAGYIFLVKGKTGGLVLAAGSIFHLLLDQMWLTPSVLLWPLFGWGFPRHDTTSWLAQLLRNFFGSPHIYVPEAIGIVILVQFFVLLALRGKLGFLIAKGRVD